MTKKREITISSIIVGLSVALFIISILLFHRHRRGKDLICYFSDYDSTDMVSISIRTHSFQIPVLGGTRPPPDSTLVNTKNMIPGTLIINYQSEKIDNSIKFILIYNGQKLDERELTNSSQVFYPLH